MDVILGCSRYLAGVVFAESSPERQVLHGCSMNAFIPGTTPSLNGSHPDKLAGIDLAETPFILAGSYNSFIAARLWTRDKDSGFQHYVILLGFSIRFAGSAKIVCSNLMMCRCCAAKIQKAPCWLWGMPIGRVWCAHSASAPSLCQSLHTPVLACPRTGPLLATSSVRPTNPCR